MQELFNAYYLNEYMMQIAPDNHVYKEYEKLNKCICKLIAFMGTR